MRNPTSKKKVKEYLKSPDISLGPPHSGTHMHPYIFEHVHTHTDVYYTDMHMNERKKDKKDSV